MATSGTLWKTNPFTGGYSKFVDYELWKAGANRFANPQVSYSSSGTMPHELDYLRGLHDLSSLALLRSFLATNLGTNTINMTSIWLDKTAKIIPTEPSCSTTIRELGDLAVVVRRRDPAKTFISMWVLQAKKLTSPSSSLPSDPSTLREIELLEKCPDFDFIRANKGRVSIKLKNDFGPVPVNYRHWSFLIFHDNPNTYVSGANPNQWRWPGTVSPVSLGSFSEAVLEQARGTAKVGAFVDQTDLPPSAIPVISRKSWLQG